MARHRKIPARKHHGVRDPLKQLEAKEKRLKNVTNHPPAKGDNQKVSFKFAQFKKLADAATAGKKIKRMHSGTEDKPREEHAGKKSGKGKQAEAPNKFGRIKQLPDETDRAYLNRVNRLTQESLREAQYEAKYNVKVERNPKTGEIIIKKKPKNEIDELLEQKSKRAKGGKTKAKVTGELMDKKTAKELIKQAIKEDNEESAKTELEEYKRDVFKFGETVHAPPTLSTLPRKATKSETVPRPGQKSNLLLKSIFDDSKEPHIPSNNNKTKNKTKTQTGAVQKVQMKGKRKDLPAATRRMLEEEREKIVELYRNLKKMKQKPMAQKN